MPTRKEAPANAFTPSTHVLGKADERETFIEQLNADCKHLRDLCWSMRSFETSFLEERSVFENAMIGGKEHPDVQKLLDKQIEFCRRETEIVTLKNSIVKRVDEANFGKSGQDRIHLTTTAEGLPIKVDTRLKTPLWGM